MPFLLHGTAECADPHRNSCNGVCSCVLSIFLSSVLSNHNVNSTQNRQAYHHELGNIDRMCATVSFESRVHWELVQQERRRKRDECRKHDTGAIKGTELFNLHREAWHGKPEVIPPGAHEYRAEDVDDLKNPACLVSLTVEAWYADKLVDQK